MLSITILLQKSLSIPLHMHSMCGHKMFSMKLHVYQVVTSACRLDRRAAGESCFHSLTATFNHKVLKLNQHNHWHCGTVQYSVVDTLNFHWITYFSDVRTMIMLIGY